MNPFCPCGKQISSPKFYRAYGGDGIVYCCSAKCADTSLFDGTHCPACGKEFETPGVYPVFVEGELYCGGKPVKQ